MCVLCYMYTVYTCTYMSSVYLYMYRCVYTVDFIYIHVHESALQNFSKYKQFQINKYNFKLQNFYMYRCVYTVDFIYIHVHVYMHMYGKLWHRESALQNFSLAHITHTHARTHTHTLNPPNFSGCRGGEGKVLRRQLSSSRRHR